MTSKLLRLPIAVLACALLAPAAAADAASSTPAYPTIKKVSPTKLGIGDTLTITGKNFRKGKSRNTVVFKKDGGRAVFVRAPKATTTRITVTVPAKLLPFLKQKSGAPVYTRFRIRVLASRFGKTFTSRAKSPMIGPKAIGGGKTTASDCDGDGIANAKDTDDDNDLLPDTTEKEIGTDACQRDTDGDGMSDGWEYQSALDRNNGRAAGALPSPNRKPYTNPLDKTDGERDQDGDGLTNVLEYAAWATFSNTFRTAPAGGSVLTYSGGNPASDGRGAVPAALTYADRDQNGFLSDFERDADGDGIPNMDEGGTKNLAGITDPAKAATDDPRYYDFGLFTEVYIEKAAELSKQPANKCAGINQVPFYCVEQAAPSPVVVSKVDPLDWLAKDTDGDGVNDDADDQDHDGVSNMTEYLAELNAAPKDRHFQQLDACIPNSDSYFCLLGSVDVDRDGIPNRDDTDDDGDGLSDVLERQIGTDPLQADTDGDGVSDDFEYRSALDLNSAALPYPGKRPYPNPLDGTDANSDFDQDVLTMAEEYKAWRYSGSPVPMNYSDGTKFAIGSVAPGLVPGIDLDGDGVLSDDERDVDDDGLTNYDETHGRMTQKWWDETYGAPPYNESTYPGPDYLEPSFVDPDTDGDGVKDGADDQDHDGYTNAFEVARPANWLTTYVSTAHAGSNPLARVQPFNPCKPTYSDYCHAHPPLGYYPPTEDWASPLHQNGP